VVALASFERLAARTELHPAFNRPGAAPARHAPCMRQRSQPPNAS
jgi:hypothetical protein